LGSVQKCIVIYLFLKIDQIYEIILEIIPITINDHPIIISLDDSIRILSGAVGEPIMPYKAKQPTPKVNRMIATELVAFMGYIQAVYLLPRGIKRIW
jgi:hypothetical protein